MFTWQTLRAKDGLIQTVDGWASLEEIIGEMASSSWEEPSNQWLSFVFDETTGHVVATGLFGPEGELLVSVSDGRQLRFPMPEFYRDTGS